MSRRSGATPAREPPRARRPLVPDAVAGTLMLVFVEIMFFAGFISAHIVYVSGQSGGVWPPPDQPLLPFARTLWNSALLLASGVTLAPVWWAYQRQERGGALVLTTLSALLGGSFVAAQGVEWAALLAQGLTMTSSGYGAFFYMIVGAHALHAVAGVGALVWAVVGLRRGWITGPHLISVKLFWYFVVVVWPVIFFQVYR